MWLGWFLAVVNALPWIDDFTIEGDRRLVLFTLKSPCPKCKEIEETLDTIASNLTLPVSKAAIVDFTEETEKLGVHGAPTFALVQNKVAHEYAGIPSTITALNGWIESLSGLGWTEVAKEEEIDTSQVGWDLSLVYLRCHRDVLEGLSVTLEQLRVVTKIFVTAVERDHPSDHPTKIKVWREGLKPRVLEIEKDDSLERHVDTAAAFLYWYGRPTFGPLTMANARLQGVSGIPLLTYISNSSDYHQIRDKLVKEASQVESITSGKDIWTLLEVYAWAWLDLKDESPSVQSYIRSLGKPGGASMSPIVLISEPKGRFILSDYLSKAEFANTANARHHPADIVQWARKVFNFELEDLRRLEPGKESDLESVQGRLVRLLKSEKSSSNGSACVIEVVSSHDLALKVAKENNDTCLSVLILPIHGARMRAKYENLIKIANVIGVHAKCLESILVDPSVSEINDLWGFEAQEADSLPWWIVERVDDQLPTNFPINSNMTESTMTLKVAKRAKHQFRGNVQDPRSVLGWLRANAKCVEIDPSLEATLEAVMSSSMHENGHDEL